MFRPSEHPEVSAAAAAECHRNRGTIPAHCPVLVTLRVLDDVPPLGRACFVRAFQASLREGGPRPGFRVVHDSVQDDHAHFLVEASGARRLGERHEKPGGAFRALREPRLRTQGRVLVDRFHHVLKRTPMDVRRALA